MGGSGFLLVSEVAEKWGISERSVRNYCAQGRVPGAFLMGKTWNIPEDAEKPERSNARTHIASSNPLLERLQEEKAAGLRGGIYHKVQVELTYNSNHIEGSRLTIEQTRLIFETSTIGFTQDAIPVDDIIETVNHFRAIDAVIDRAAEPLSEGLIKDLHRVLKSGTTDSARSWFNVGEYKGLPNEVGGRSTTDPKEVGTELRRLLDDYRQRSQHTLEDIIAFHVAFERIHPFQDGNGRVGRLIMFKECLASQVTPFIITEDMKPYYYRGLSEWDRERGFLMDTCRAAQDRFGEVLTFFQIPAPVSSAGFGKGPAEPGPEPR